MKKMPPKPKTKDKPKKSEIRCGNCGKKLKSYADEHTWEDCIKFRNEMK